jgi:hypothetical protein
MFYSISPLSRNRIKQHSSTLIPHHRWTEMELTYGKLNYLMITLQKLNSPVSSISGNMKIHFSSLRAFLDFLSIL